MYRLYFSIPAANANDTLPPKFLAREKWTEINQLDEVVEVSPSWLQYQEKNKGQLGVPAYRTYNGDKFLIIGFIPSALSGILTELEGLGAGLQPPNFTVWTADEINAFAWDKESEE